MWQPPGPLPLLDDVSSKNPRCSEAALAESFGNAYRLFLFPTSNSDTYQEFLTIHDLIGVLRSVIRERTEHEQTQQVPTSILQ